MPRLVTAVPVFCGACPASDLGLCLKKNAKRLCLLKKKCRAKRQQLCDRASFPPSHSAPAPKSIHSQPGKAWAHPELWWVTRGLAAEANTQYIHILPNPGTQNHSTKCLCCLHLLKGIALIFTHYPSDMGEHFTSKGNRRYI